MRRTKVTCTLDADLAAIGVVAHAFSAFAWNVSLARPNVNAVTAELEPKRTSVI
ncbi:MAG: hypothetical protein ACC628_11985 [Pirellulaceae bacterium]